MSPASRVTIRCLVVGLAAFSFAMTGKGLWTAWSLDRDIDMQSRVREYDWFRQGVYPTRPLEPDLPATSNVPFTVYPPYALVMFTPFFEPFGKNQGRIIIEALSFLSLIALGLYGYRLLRAQGPEAGWLGAVAACAISGNGNAIALGQFSILCTGALLMQIVMLERGRGLAAGAWWALAMLKPQIGVAFAGLFFVRREWRGLALGAAILAALSLVACWWTEVSPATVIRYWAFEMNTNFAEGRSMPSRLSAALGVPRRVIHLVVGGVLLVLVPVFMPRRESATVRAEPLVLATFAALLGQLLVYHRFYDNVMMFPLLFLSLRAACRQPTPWTIGVAVMVGLSLWTPHRLYNTWEYEWFVRTAVWTAATVALLAGEMQVNAEACAVVESTPRTGRR